MKKALFILSLILITSFSIYSFSNNKVKTLEGYIKAYGNEPFVYPGFTTIKGKQYGLHADEAMLKDLLSTQGKNILITGIVFSDKSNNLNLTSLKDGFIEVESFEVNQ